MARSRTRASGNAKSSTAKPAAAKTEAKKGPIRRVEAASKATWGIDDKRAQYARLVVFNYGVERKLIAKTKDVNSATNAELEKAGKELNSGTLLKGKDGIELIQKHTQKGATDEKVADRGLTTAYAQEVRPFLMRLEFSDSFGRRGRKAAAEPQEEAEEAAA